MSARGGDKKTYLLGQRDKTGFVLGLSLVQVMIVGCGMGLMVLMRLGGSSFLATLVPAGIGALVATVRWQNRFAYEWVRVLFNWWLGRKSRVWWTEEPWDGAAGEVPAVLEGVAVTTESIRTGPAAVVWDRTRGEATMILRASGLDFEVLVDREQDALLEEFGRAIAAFATEGSAVKRIGWYEVAVRQSLQNHARFVRRQPATSENAERRAGYLAMVDEIGSSTTNHDVFVTVTASGEGLARRSPGLRGRRVKSGDERMIDALDTAVAQLRRGLEDSGIRVSAPVATGELAAVMQRAIDPSKALGLLPATGRLRNRIGNVSRMGPQETEEEFRLFATDMALHRTYRIAGFPRTAQSADWMVKLLARPEQARTVSIVFEPVPPRRSQTEVNRRLAKLDAGERVKKEQGRRISRAEDQAREDVLELERDLVNGFGVVGYYGLVTVSAMELDQLAAAAEEFEASAATAGLVLAPCDGEQSRGWALTLPLGLGAGMPGFEL